MQPPSRIPTFVLIILLFIPLLTVPDLKVSAQSARPVPDLPSLIGLSLAEVYQILGPPAEVYSLRGQQPSQDDVVFYYTSHLYLFWFQNRVWQVRTDGRFQGLVFSLPMGVSRAQVIAELGQPILESEDSLVFHIEDRGYPVQARFYFEGELLNDVYCYRGDL